MIPFPELSIPFGPPPAPRHPAAHSFTPVESIGRETPPNSKVEAPFTSFWGGPRCHEKGCVFPAGSGTRGLCQDHDRRQSEPAHFQTCQPTLLLLKQGAFGLSNTDGKDSRAQDRLRLAAQSEAFHEGLA